MTDVLRYHDIDRRGLGQSVGYVAVAGRTPHYLLQFRSGMRRVHFNAYPAESQAFVVSTNAHRKVRKLYRSFATDVIDGHRETNRQRREQQLGRCGARISATGFGRFIGDQLEATYRNATSISALPVGGYFHE